MSQTNEDNTTKEVVNQDAIDRTARRDLDGKLFGVRNKTLCQARVAKRSGDMAKAKTLLESARKIAPLTIKEQAGYDRA